MSNRRFARFIVAGGVNTIFGYTVFSALIYIGTSSWIALASSSIAGILFNFLTIGGYAFRNLDRRNFPRFVGSYLTIYFANLILIESFIIHAHLSAIAAQGILIAPMASLSYLLMKIFVFRRA